MSKVTNYSLPYSNAIAPLKRNKKLNYWKAMRFDINGNYISTYNINKQLCKENNLCYNTILLTCKGKSLSYLGDIWIRQDEYSDEELQRRIELKKNDPNINPVANSRAKKIAQIDLKGNIVKIWDSINQTKEYGCNLSHICSVLNGSRKTHLGFKWEYYNNN